MPQSSVSSLPHFADRLVHWQLTHGRHHLPWQNTRDAYRIWLSEIMLQQTQVSTVLPYYERFLQRFPDVFALAIAPEDDVLALWAGLGYYSRARNLHKAAKQVVALHGGQFPADLILLEALPGVGQSTAAAIAAFAYDVIAPILDGNVKRVIARHAGVEGYPGATTVSKRLWQEARERLPSNASQMPAYTQGLMDLGASLCRRSSPLCDVCPLSEDCVAQQSGRTDEIPAPKPSKPLPQRSQRYLLAVQGDQVLLVKRPAPGIWGGLWCLPELADEESSESALTRRFGYSGSFESTPLPALEHTFTHFRLTLRPEWTAVPEFSTGHAVHDAPTQWLPWTALEQTGLPTPIRRILLAARANLPLEG